MGAMAIRFFSVIFPIRNGWNNTSNCPTQTSFWSARHRTGQFTPATIGNNPTLVGLSRDLDPIAIFGVGFHLIIE
jgi:hypothetical protein